MKNIILLLIFFSLFTNILNAQVIDYKNASLKPGANYYTIIKSVREYFNQQRAILISDNKNPEKDNNFRELNSQFERWAFFWQDRVNPDGSFPNSSAGWKNAIQANPNLIETSSPNIIETGVPTWTNIGPNDSSILNGWSFGAGIGRVNVIKRSPINKSYMLAGTASGGVFKTINLGTNWDPFTDQFAGLGISDIVFNPTNDQMIFVATGDYDASHMNSIGIMKTVDGGSTWTNPLTFTVNQNIRIKHIYLDPNFSTNNTLYCTSTDGIYTSTNSGDTWTKTYGSQSDENFIDLIKIGSNYFASDAWGRLYKSTTDIASLTATYTPSPFGSGNKLTFSYSANTPDILYCLFQANPAFAKYSIIANTMSTLTNVTNSVPADNSANYNSQGGYNQVIAVNPNNGNDLVVGEFSTKRSSDGGTTWVNLLNGYYTTTGATNWGGGYVHSDNHYLEFIGNDSLLIGNDGGVYIGKISTASYKQCFNGLKATQSYSIAIHDPSPNNLIIGNQDNDGSSRIDNGSTQKWYGAQAGDGTSTAISRNNSNIRYVGGTNGSLSFRNDAFETNYSGDGIDKPSNGGFVWPLEMHITDGTILYGGYTGVYKMTGAPKTNATDWVNLNAGTTGTIRFINLANNLTDVLKQRIVVIDVNNNVRKTLDEATWSTITKPTGVNFNSIYWSRNNNDTMYATASSYTAGNKVYFSSNGGSSWINISNNLPNILTKKVLKYEGSDTIFLATELGVYFARLTNVSGTPTISTWDKYGSGLPNVRVDDMELSYTSKKLFAGTFGRGVWVVDLQIVVVSAKDIKFSSNKTNLENSYNLSWLIADNNIESTTLEKSDDGYNFSKVETFVDSKKQKNENYNVVVNENENYYRIYYDDYSQKRYYSNVIRINSLKKSNISIYPNPTSDYIWISNDKNISTVSVYSLNGKQLTYAKPNSKTYFFDMSLLSKGVFFIKIKDENGYEVTEKVIVK